MCLLGRDRYLDPVNLRLELSDVFVQLLDREAVELARRRGLLARFDVLDFHGPPRIASGTAAAHSSAFDSPWERHDRQHARHRNLRIRGTRRPAADATAGAEAV